MAKQPRHVALIDVRDFPRGRYTAFWEIVVQGAADEGYRFHAKLISYEPIAWSYQGNVTPERPDVPEPVYPKDVPVRQAEYAAMTADEQSQVRAAQDARRRKIAEIYEATPKPVTQVDELIGVADTLDEADTLAQQWVLAEMPKYRRRAGGGLNAIALCPPPDLIGEFLRGLWRGLRDIVRLAIAYSTTVRNNQLNQVRDGIDGGAGAGLLRIYDGSRPATCGTATTLLAELTFSDPCAGAASSGALTMSSITADSSANATGTASWFRAVDSTGTCCIDGNVGTSGSDMNLNSTSISSGQQVSCTSFVITGGNA